MPTISNTSFTVRFDLTGTPTLRLTDTTTAPPVGLVGIFEITQPDGYTRTGNISSPDIVAGGTFSFPLTLDSNGGVQQGQYTIKFTATAPSFLSTDFTRTFQFAYTPVNLKLREEFDVFTPQLRYFDDTVYSVSNWSSGSITRAWSASSTPTGVKTGSGVSLDMIHNGSYYDANYNVTLTSSALYTHQVYSWLTVEETVSKSISTYAETPDSVAQIVSRIVDLKNSLENKIDTINEYNQTKQDFEFAQSLFEHILHRIKVQNLSGIYRDLKDLIAILNNYQIPTYVPLNSPILPYNLNSIFNGAVWGQLTGNIQDQTDLWTILQSLTVQTNYIHDQQVASATWVVTHNMGKYPSVSIVDTADDEVIGQVTYNSNNQLTITFSAPMSGKAYLN